MEDKEWDIAVKTGTRETYWIYPNYGWEPDKRFLRCYTPATAKLMASRNCWRVEPFCNSSLETYDYSYYARLNRERRNF